MKVWDRALNNVQPKVEVKSRRVGGATYQVPVDVRPDRAHRARHALAHHGGARPLATADDAGEAGGRDPRRSANKGNAVKKREDTHKMAEANKAFAHYRW